MKENNNKPFLLLLRSKGYNQTTFAQAIGLTCACVNKWVVGKSVPSVEHVNKIAEILKLSVAEVNAVFFGGGK